MKGARKGVMKEGAAREGLITRGTHLTAVYPALFSMDLFYIKASGQRH